jgi:hypothetical protein
MCSTIFTAAVVQSDAHTHIHDTYKYIHTHTHTHTHTRTMCSATFTAAMAQSDAHMPWPGLILEVMMVSQSRPVSSACAGGLSLKAELSTVVPVWYIYTCRFSYTNICTFIRNMNTYTFTTHQLGAL